MIFNTIIKYFYREKDENYTAGKKTKDSRKKTNNCYQKEENSERTRLKIETSTTETEEFDHSQKLSLCNEIKNFSEYRRKKTKSPISKMKKYFSKKSGEKDKNMSNDGGQKFKSKEMDPNFCLAKETRKSKRSRDLEKREKKKRKKSKILDEKKMSFKMRHDICTCEMCQLFNVGEDEIAGTQSVDCKRSRERQKRKMRKRWKGSKRVEKCSDTKRYIFPEIKRTIKIYNLNSVVLDSIWRIKFPLIPVSQAF